MELVPGKQAAGAVFESGLWLDGVVRRLVAELGFTKEDSKNAAMAALAERLHTEAARSD